MHRRCVRVTQNSSKFTLLLASAREIGGCSCLRYFASTNKWAQRSNRLPGTAATDRASRSSCYWFHFFFSSCWHPVFLFARYRSRSAASSSSSTINAEGYAVHRAAAHFTHVYIAPCFSFLTCRTQLSDLIIIGFQVLPHCGNDTQCHVASRTDVYVVRTDSTTRSSQCKRKTLLVPRGNYPTLDKNVAAVVNS